MRLFRPGNRNILQFPEGTDIDPRAVLDNQARFIGQVAIVPGSIAADDILNSAIKALRDGANADVIPMVAPLSFDGVTWDRWQGWIRAPQAAEAAAQYLNVRHSDGLDLAINQNVTASIPGASRGILVAAALQAHNVGFGRYDPVRVINNRLQIAWTGSTGVERGLAADPIRTRAWLRNPADTVDLGDATNPVRVDPTGTTEQPVRARGNLPTAHATGRAVAPAAATVLADTGALAAGDYEVVAHVGSDDTAAAGKDVEVEHRDAANTATLHRHLVPVPGAGSWYVPRIALALNERIRVVTGAAGAAGSIYTADIYVRVNG